MKLKGSCHCQAVKFTFKSDNFYPYQRCYCSICRKTQGGGGYAINISAEAASLKITGKKHIKIYKALISEPGKKRRLQSTAERNFCGICASALWLFSPEWPELFHPFASAIDTPLPVPPEHTHCMVEFIAPWVEIQKGQKDKIFKQYPRESIADWHQRVVYKSRDTWDCFHLSVRQIKREN